MYEWIDIGRMIACTIDAGWMDGWMSDRGFKCFSKINLITLTKTTYL